MQIKQWLDMSTHRLEKLKNLKVLTIPNFGKDREQL